jgi:Ca-activated chloride channel family protein
VSFAHPWVLLLLPLPLALLVWVWRGRMRRVALPLDHVTGRPSRAWRLALDAASSLAPLALALAIVLLAGPLRWGEPKTRRALTNIEFCVDVSCSMMAEFGAATRYDASMEAINEFIDYREGDAFGLTIFGNQVLHWVPLTSDASAFRCAPPFLRPERLPYWFGGTEIGKALRACREVLVAREEGDRMVILVSDGYSWDLDGGNDAVIARELEEAGIVVFTVHVADGEVPLEVQTIADGTGGRVFAAGDPTALGEVFRAIDAMRPARLQRSIPEASDHFVPFAAAGLVVLGLGLLSGLGLRYTPW